MIEFKNTSMGYKGKVVLEKVNLSFEMGKLTVLLGPNGSGKSTALKTALGLIPPISGQVLYDGKNISEMKPSETAKQAAYMAQSRSVPNITAKRLVLHGRFPYLSIPRQYRKEDKDAADRALEAVGATDIADSLMSELSGGQRQKIYLAMALVQDTPTVFMDEPTSFLDIGHRLELMKTARALADSGKAVVMVLHDIPLSLKNADCIALFSDGELRYCGEADEIYSSGEIEKAFGIKLEKTETDYGSEFFCR